MEKSNCDRCVFCLGESCLCTMSVMLKQIWHLKNEDKNCGKMPLTASVTVALVPRPGAVLL